MQHQLRTIAPGLSILTPFIPAPLAVQQFCTCGEHLSLEMERDLGTCVDCQAEAAGVTNRMGTVQ